MIRSIPHPSTKNREFHADDVPTYDTRGPVRWIVSHLLRYPWLVTAFVIATVLMSALTSAIPRITGLAFDAVLAPTADMNRLTVLAAAILAIVVVRGIVDLASAFSIETLGQRLERDTREELYLSLLGKSQTFHNRQRVGDIMARASNDVRQLNPMMNPGVALITDSLISIIVPIVFIATIDPRLLAVPLVYVVVFGFALTHYMRQLNPVSGAMRRQFGVLNASLNETITGIEVVKATAGEDQERTKFLGNASGFRDLFIRQGYVQARYLPVLLLGVAVTAAFAHGLHLLSLGALSVGELVAFMGLLGILRFPTFISIFTFSLVQLGLAGATRILELMDEETELDENAGGHAAPLRGEIEFRNVTFSFGGSSGAPALRNVSFRCAPGQTVAIVGQTGSGKSTITKLVNRTYDATRGQVLIDGVDVRDWNLESLRSQMGVIEQDVFLFSRTVAENIAFGVGDRATADTIRGAARAAQADDFIESFEDGYDTVVGERGVTLSGGQRQRIAIARALLTDPRVLILDDSTSAIDSATEDRIQRAILTVLEGRTSLVITHRLSQIRKADLILVMHRGELVDAGTHEELLERTTVYGRMFARYDA